eukprot:TRINITY_DN10536_c0_g1_i5.p1 TRINITY_DN10536_c0_g1~~TRINITY_DN10536_c0_g1_i5.p1  ORF type:complete len:372 (+),score=90.29 TRINITY_DN10536_c0_g1_i5:95-1117(+)
MAPEALANGTPAGADAAADPQGSRAPGAAAAAGASSTTVGQFSVGDRVSLAPGCAATDVTLGGALRHGEVGRILSCNTEATPPTYRVEGPACTTFWYAAADLVPAPPRGAPPAAAPALPSPPRAPDGRATPQLSSRGATPAFNRRSQSPGRRAPPSPEVARQRDYVRRHGLHVMLGEAMDACLRDLPPNPFAHIAQTLLHIRARSRGPAPGLGLAASPLPGEAEPTPRLLELEREVSLLRQRLVQTQAEAELEKEVLSLRRQVHHLRTPSPSPVPPGGDYSAGYPSAAHARYGAAATPGPQRSAAAAGDLPPRPSSALDGRRPPQPHPPPRPHTAVGHRQ